MQSRIENNQPQAYTPNSLRPLDNVVVRLDCGCEHTWPGSVETAPHRGMIIYCFHHMEDTRVGEVRVVQR